MEKFQLQNIHLKKVLAEMNVFLKDNIPFDDDLIFKFIMELRLSNLLIPAFENGEYITFPDMESDSGLKILPLFTDYEEFLLYGGDFEYFSNDFAYYVSLVKNLKLDGIIINCCSDEFFIDSELIGNIRPVESFSFKNHYDDFEARKLKSLAENTDNKSLDEFIRSNENFNIGSLKLFLSQSLLFNLVLPFESVTYENDIIRKKDVGGFSLPVSKGITKNYGILFTSVDTIRKSLEDTSIHYYYQIANIYEYFKFILMNDMDGIVINPDLDDYYIQRNVLLELLEDCELFNNSIYQISVNYAFLISEK